MPSSTPLHTPFCDLLGCRYPILQAGMGGVARAELVVAVAGAGGFGCLGMVRESPDLIRQQVDQVRALTSNPFAVNLIPSATDPDLFRAELDECVRLRIPVLMFFWDVVADAVARAKDAGCLVIHQVGSVEHAKRAEAAGADMIIAQGVEAGGHVHGMVSSLVLLPQVVDAVSIPVVGSGGFASGRSLVAALALGAHGIHCGTAFLATKESFAHDVHKQKILSATECDTIHTDAFAINWPPHSNVRVLKTEVTESIESQPYGHLPDKIPRRVVAEEQGRPIYWMSTDSPLKSMTGDLEKLAMYAGQVTGQITQIEDVQTVIHRIVAEAEATLQQLSNRS
ncbi:NAD(P)H-dependent flavin oxidoreductase [Aporhodopirellula aestuarii]|uniref:Nitronate monooxygenase n=1 Tax=Aporhodopirellula aestuarii TaxID=2950107 RepID=A0ABT0TYK9_9BACT|nr:nitronate monooxygenase [Aporhodopirellula aestuarii]MCM2369687.1 nitronate monooxygenase [Aporhodopirellula aestuarii]